METVFSQKLDVLRETAESVVEKDIAPFAEQVDRDCLWPAHSMRSLAAAGLTGLQVPTALGGHGQGLLALTAIAEIIGHACPSSALCFGMHCVGTAVMSAKATPYQQNHYLRPIVC